MDDMELLHMVLPYVVSTVVFVILGIGFYLKDVVFNFFDGKKQDHYRKKYGIKTTNSDKYRIKSVRKKNKTAS